MKYNLIAISHNSVSVIREYNDITKLAKEVADCMAVNIRSLMVTVGDKVIFENSGINKKIKVKELESMIFAAKGYNRMLTEREKKIIERIKYRVI